MAKIHVRGGSLLKLKFVDDSDNDLNDCQLSLVGSGPWYTVRRASGLELQAEKEPKSLTIFRSCGNTTKKIEIGYSDTLRTVSKPRPASKRRPVSK